MFCPVTRRFLHALDIPKDADLLGSSYAFQFPRKPYVVSPCGHLLVYFSIRVRHGLHANIINLSTLNRQLQYHLCDFLYKKLNMRETILQNNDCFNDMFVEYVSR